MNANHSTETKYIMCIKGTFDRCIMNACKQKVRNALDFEKKSVFQLQ